MGNAGAAIILICSLAAMAFIGSLWAGYVSNAYLSVLQETAAGLDDVHWPDFSPFEWFATLIQLGWMVLFWLFPSWLLALAINPIWAGTPDGLAGVFFLVVWLIVPISLLSCLSATSRLFVLYWPFLRRLAKHPLPLAGFILSSGAVLAVGIYFAVRAVFHSMEYALAGGPVVCASIILHSRLVGRLAYQVAYHTPEPKKPRKKKVRPPTTEEPGAPPKVVEALPEIAPEIVESPPPEEEEDEWAPNKKAYGVLESNPASWEKEADKPSYLEPSEPYNVKPPEENAPYVLPWDGYRPVGIDAVTAEQGTQTVDALHASPFEQRLARRRQLPPRPKILFITGVYSFLLYERTMQAWLYMSLGAWAIIFLARLMRTVWIV